MNASQASLRENIPVKEYIRRAFVPLSHLAHGWEMHSAVRLTPAEERTMAREPVEAVPESIAHRLGMLRVLLVPFIGCFPTGDVVAFSDPGGEKHSAVWLENQTRIDLVVACRDFDAHDTGFELLASVAELLRSRLTPSELERYTNLLNEEFDGGVGGEIDQDAYEAKQPLRGRRSRAGAAFSKYRDISFTSTCAEYMHGLWHDVQIRVGPEHLPVPALRKRMILMAEMFPPNAGYRLFAEGDEG
ncbi:MAG: hypothetical protein M1404_03915 [Acidobacteria bacterium]|nr:hypothetical protein [Acidobacteriota bacterium]